jgi:hypothetical protein
MSPLRSLPSAPAGAGAGGGGCGPDARSRDIFFWTSCLNPRMRPTSDTPLVRPPDSPACRIKNNSVLFYMSVLPPVCETLDSEVCSWHYSVNEHMEVCGPQLSSESFSSPCHDKLTLWSNVNLKKLTHAVYGIRTLTHMATSAHH